jgi:hypothetical protein
MIISKRRRGLVAVILGLAAAAVLVLAGWSANSVLDPQGRGAVQVSQASSVSAIKRPPVTYATASSVPVLVYHEMNNGCAPTAPVCVANDPETVSTTQFTNEMAYLVKEGYHSVTLAQYTDWLQNAATRLPTKPVLITADNGIGNFLEGAQPVLEHDGFQATAFLVTGFADGAGGACAPKLVVAGKSYDVQPGCGPDNKGWDLTWEQIEKLSPAAWSFALEAGPSGHFVQDYDGTRCQMFDACKVPGETDAQYEARVKAENASGLHELTTLLGNRVSADAWVVPYSDLGYQRCAQDDCTPQPSTGPKSWLVHYASAHFTAVFVEDAFRNGVAHERFRFDVNGQDTEKYFQSALAQFTAAGDFRR